MMNIRFPHALETFPTAVQRLPAAIRRADSRTRLIASLFAILAAVGLVWYLVDLLSAPSTRLPPPPPVRVGVARLSDVTVVEHTLGTVLANSTVQLAARVTGQVMSVAFREGDVVHAGQLLFQIDPRPFKAALAQARAALARDQANYVSATNDQRRFVALFAQGAVSSQQRDQAVAAAKSLAATVLSDRAAIDVALLNLGYTQIRSPIDGKTGPILIQPGNIVTAGNSGIAGTSGASGNTLVVITQIQPVKVSFALPQSDLPRIQSQLRAHALTVSTAIHDSSGKLIEAPVDFVDNAISAQTGTIELRATYPNADGSLVPGQMVDIAVALGTLRRAVVVPHEAVNIGPDSRFVYVVDKDGNAQLRPVAVRYDTGTAAAVSGRIKAGDRVVTDGQLQVVPGKPVLVLSPHGRAARKP